MLSMTNKVWAILNKKQQRELIIIGLMMLFGAVMESLSVSLILPRITAVMNTVTWSDTWYAKIICGAFVFCICYLTNGKLWSGKIIRDRYNIKTLGEVTSQIEKKKFGFIE